MRAVWAGLAVGAAVLSGLVLVGTNLERQGRLADQAAPRYRIEQVELGAPLKKGRSTRLPKGSAVVLQAGCSKKGAGAWLRPRPPTASSKSRWPPPCARAAAPACPGPRP